MVTPKPGHTPAEMAKLVNEELQKLDDRRHHRARARAGAELDARAVPRSPRERPRKSRSAQLLQLLRWARPTTRRQDAARYDKVTVADVKRVAVAYLGKPRVTLTVVPEGKRDLMVTGVVQ